MNKFLVECFNLFEETKFHIIQIYAVPAKMDCALMPRQHDWSATVLRMTGSIHT